MIENLNIKCDSITEIGTGAFREPELEITAKGVSIDGIIDQLDRDELLTLIGESEVVDWLENKGFTVLLEE